MNFFSFILLCSGPYFLKHATNMSFVATLSHVIFCLPLPLFPSKCIKSLQLISAFLGLHCSGQTIQVIILLIYLQLVIPLQFLRVTLFIILFFLILLHIHLNILFSTPLI